MKEPASEPEVIHEALRDPDSVARYLHAIADGLSSGTLRFSSEEVELQLHPGSLIGFELAAGKEHGRARVRVRLTWREDPGSGQPPDGLKISSK